MPLNPFTAHRSRQHHRYASLAALLLMLLAAASPALAGISFVHPSPQGVVSRSDYLVVKLNNLDITDVRLSINGVAGDLLKTGTPEYRKAFRDMLILQAYWDPGKNKVLLEAFQGDKLVESATLEFIYRPKAGDPVPGFARKNFHLAANERLCSPCHNMNPSAAQTEESLGKGNPCYGCHYKIISLPYVHGPAGTFSCGYCHDGKSAPRYQVARREAPLCAECHVEMVAQMNKKKLRHGPVDAGMCEICHDMHGSANPAQLIAPINELCLSCHENVGKEIHAVQTGPGVGHPLSGRPDISQPGSGRMLSCVSCHDPHAGDYRFYFRKNAAVAMEICQNCHMK